MFTIDQGKGSSKSHTIPTRILVVDDDEAIQTTVSTFLESEGYEVITASNGQMALDMLLVEGIHVDLILLDLQMPFMNGWQFAHYLRKHSSPAKKPVPIVITSAGHTGSEEEAASVFDGYLQKPFSLEAMIETCNKFCRAEASEKDSSLSHNSSL